ncbi:hypothetical protein [Cytobacillus purgationiresistens]|uniref:Uncharacterized protein n=1 Tax=Cytobacillus purgationiresistens TaxID=863449 RepID=A0ABU0AL48_9BACI|nr:hypothetical protein [Cytobacillus purgationiresistens]MDQ0270770.1 hypothetical protein [Cytobacillus purgationiresistens]
MMARLFFAGLTILLALVSIGLMVRGFYIVASLTLTAAAVFLLNEGGNDKWRN